MLQYKLCFSNTISEEIGFKKYDQKGSLFLLVSEASVKHVIIIRCLMRIKSGYSKLLTCAGSYFEHQSRAFLNWLGRKGEHFFCFHRDPASLGMNISSLNHS